MVKKQFSHQYIHSVIYDVKTDGAVVVSQLGERSLLTPEVHSSNPVIGKQPTLTITFIEKAKTNKKEFGTGPF